MRNKRIFFILIRGVSKKWDIPEHVLIEVARLYSLYAMRYGDVAAFTKGLGYILHRDKFNYLIRQIKKKAVDNFTQNK